MLWTVLPFGAQNLISSKTNYWITKEDKKRASSYVIIFILVNISYWLKQINKVIKEILLIIPFDDVVDKAAHSNRCVADSETSDRNFKMNY